MHISSKWESFFRSGPNNLAPRPKNLQITLMPFSAYFAGRLSGKFHFSPALGIAFFLFFTLIAIQAGFTELRRALNGRSSHLTSDFSTMD
jgi:hypothetical protein